MAYKIGQLRQNPDNNQLVLTKYYDRVAVNETTATTVNPYNENQPFSDYALSGEFLKNQVYFLRVIIGKSQTDQLIYSLKLRSDINEQFLSTFTVNQAVTGEDNPFYTYSLIFKPNSNYNLLIFELQKTAQDYTNPGTRKWKSIDYSINGIICRLENIISRTYSKIGFQSRPGELIAINGSPIRVGKSGIYELDNGTPISRVMIAPNAQNQIDAFLLDYMYNDDEQEEI